MRTCLLALLIASTAAGPALAQSVFEQRRADREQVGEPTAGQARARPTRRQRAAEPQRELRAPGLVPLEPRQPRPAIDQAIDRGRPSTGLNRVRPVIVTPGRDARDSVAGWRSEERARIRGSLGEALSGRIDRRRVTPPADARPDRPAPPPRTATRHRSSPRWATSWHRDRRYDWRDYRHRNRWLFRLGDYFDPFGWSYYRFHRGWRLWPSYYDGHYWLRDPFMYRLPRAPYPYRWIRYWDDALLVDLYTGEVVDVVHDFFW